MDFFNTFKAGYAALSGPVGQTQSATDAIDKLADRLANGETVEDRRTALLGIKGLSRDWKGVRSYCYERCPASQRKSQDVGLAVLPVLVTILERDAPEDSETAKIVLETLNVLCEVEDVEVGHRVSWFLAGLVYFRSKLFPSIAFTGTLCRPTQH